MIGLGGIFFAYISCVLRAEENEELERLTACLRAAHRQAKGRESGFAARERGEWKWAWCVIKKRIKSFSRFFRVFSGQKQSLFSY